MISWKRFAGKLTKGGRGLRRFAPYLVPIPVLITLTDLHGTWELVSGWVSRGEAVTEEQSGLFTFEGRAGDAVIISAATDREECQLSFDDEERHAITKPGLHHRLVHWLPRDDTYRLAWHPTDCEGKPVVERTALRMRPLGSLALQLNAPVLGVLESCDSSESDCTPEESGTANWVLDVGEDEMREGQFISLAAHSDDFDPDLVLTSGESALAQDADAGPGKNPWMVLPALTPGSYAIHVSGKDFSASAGAYELTAYVFDVQTLTHGIPSHAALEEVPHLEPPWWHGDSRIPLVAWTFAGQESDVVSVTAASDDFDPFLGLFRLGPAASSAWLASDDDIGGDTHSTAARVARPLPSDATYLAVVQARGGGSGDTAITAEALRQASLDLDSASGKFTTRRNVQYDQQTVHAWELNPVDQDQLALSPVINVDITPEGEGFNPQVTLYTPDGDDLPSYPGAPALTQAAYLRQQQEGNETETRAPLILITAGTPGSYGIEAEIGRPEVLRPNTLHRASLAQKKYWSIDASESDHLSVGVVLVASASQFTPCIRLMSPDGNVLAAAVGPSGERSVELVWPSDWIGEHLVQVTANDHDVCLNGADPECQEAGADCNYGIHLRSTNALSLDRGVDRANQLPIEGQLWEFKSAQDSEIGMTLISEVDGFVPSIFVFSSGQPPHLANLIYSGDGAYFLKRRLERDSTHIVRVSQEHNLTDRSGDIPYMIRLDTVAEELVPGDAMERMIQDGHTLRILRDDDETFGRPGQRPSRMAKGTLMVTARSRERLILSLTGPDSQRIGGEFFVEQVSRVPPEVEGSGEYRSWMIARLSVGTQIGEYLVSLGGGGDILGDTFAQVAAYWVTPAGRLQNEQERCRCLAGGEAHAWTIGSEDTNVVHPGLVSVRPVSRCGSEMGAGASIGPIALLHGDEIIAVGEAPLPEVSVQLGQREPTEHAVIVSARGTETTCYSAAFQPRS